MSEVERGNHTIAVSGHRSQTRLPSCDSGCPATSELTRRISTIIRDACEVPNFIACLDEIETNVAPELYTTVTDVSGDDWLRPYRAVIEDHRKREARRSPPTA